MCAVEKRGIGTGVPPRRDDLAIKVGTIPITIKRSRNRTAKDVWGVVPLQDMAEENEESEMMVAKF